MRTTSERFVSAIITYRGRIHTRQHLLLRPSTHRCRGVQAFGLSFSSRSCGSPRSSRSAAPVLDILQHPFARKPSPGALLFALLRVHFVAVSPWKWREVDGRTEHVEAPIGRTIQSKGRS